VSAQFPSDNMDLFDHALHERMKTEAPLAARMRPRTLDEFVGQEEIVGPGKLLRRAIEADRLFSSIILWGPPGTGKTTLAQIIANQTKSHFETLSAVLAGKAELREVLERALERRKLYQKRTILFVKQVVETLNSPEYKIPICSTTIYQKGLIELLLDHLVRFSFLWNILLLPHRAD
jgi:replication-associated recombination protein RarA